MSGGHSKTCKQKLLSLIKLIFSFKDFMSDIVSCLYIAKLAKILFCAYNKMNVI